MKRAALFRFIPFRFAAIVAPLLAAWPKQAQAATLNWTGLDATNNWGAAANWGGTIPAAGDVLQFGGTTNVLTNNDLAAFNGSGLSFTAGAANFFLGGNALTLSDSGLGAPFVENNSLNSLSTIGTGLAFTGGGSGLAAIRALSGDLHFTGPLSLTPSTNLDVVRNAGRTVVFGGNLAAGDNRVTFSGAGTTALVGTMVVSNLGQINVTGGRFRVLSAGALGTAAAATNAVVNVSSGAQVDLNGVALTGAGKSFNIAGTGTDGAGALVNNYIPVDANKAIANLTLSGNATIGGTQTIDIGNGTAGQVLDGGGFTLTLASRSRFNIRTAITNLPQIVVNAGNVEMEGVDAPATTAVTLNGPKTTMGAWLGGTNTVRTWAGDVTLNNGANIGGIGTGGAANTLVIGSAGKTLTINGEGRLNMSTAGFIDWSGISGGGNMRVESAVTGSGKLVVGHFGVATNGTTVTLAQDNPGFSGAVEIRAGNLQIGNGGTTGTLGSGRTVNFLNGGGTPTLTINRSGNLALNTAFTGTGNIHVDNTGAVVTLSGPNTIGGAGASAFGLRVRAGTLIVGAANALSPRQTLEIGGLGIGTGSLTKLNGFSVAVERFDDASTDTAGVFNRLVNDSAIPATLTFNINNAGPVFGDFGGTLGGSTADENNFGITKIGANDWTLAGSAHSYTGLTTINGGTIRLGNDTTGGIYGIGKLGSSTGTADGTVVNPGGSFDFGGLSAGDERLSISGRGHTYTTHGFEAGALRNNPGTAAASTNSAKFVSLAGNASIGKAGSGADVNNWEIANAGGTATLSLNGNTLRKVGNNIVKVSDVTGGTGAGDIVVRQGTLSIERGTVVDGPGTVTVNSRSALNLNDNGAAITLSKRLQLNSGSLINQGGSHTLSGVSTGGYFTAENNSAADTLTLGSITGPARGTGAYIGTTGTVALSGYAAGDRLGAGFVAGATPGAALPAAWDGTKVVTVATGGFTAGADALVTAAATTTADLDVRTLTSQADVIVNNGSLLRITDGTVVQRGANHWIQSNAGAIGRLTSGRADGELHLNLPEALDTAARGDITLRLQVTDNPVTTGAAAGTHVPNLFVLNGYGSATNFGGTSAAGATFNSYTAGTILNGGRVSAQYGSAFGAGPITIRDGGQLASFTMTTANGAHVSNALSLAGAGVLENAGALGAIRLGNAVTFSGNTLLAEDTRLHAHGAGDVGTMAGIVRGAANLDKTGDGVLALVSANTYTGTTTITRGTLATNRIANGGIASGLGMSSSAAANLVLNGGTLRYDGPAASTDRGFTLDLQGGAISSNYHTGGLTLNPGTVALTPGADRTLTLNATNATTNVFNGVLSDPVAGRSNLTMGGMGTWQITRDQNFTGNVTVTSAATNVQGGTLIVGTGGTTGSIGNGMSITLANASDIAFNRSDTFTLNQAITGAANSEIIQMGSGTLVLGGTADNATGNLRVENGTVILAKNSNQNVHAAAVNMFINNGTVQVAGTGDDQVFNGTAIFMKSTGTLDLNGRYEGVGRVEGLGGTITNTAAGTTAELRIGNISSVYSGTFTPGVIGSTGTGGFHGVIQDGAGIVRVSKDGATHIGLNGNNTYSGGTEILQGTLQVGRNGGSTGSLGSGPVFLGAGDFGTNGANVGTLRVDRSGTLTMNQVISGPGNVDKRGAGELVLTAANKWEGVTVVRNGTLTANLAATDNVLPVNAGYSLEGGTLRIQGRAAGNSLQSFNPANAAMTNVSGSGAGAAAATFNIQGGNIVGDNNGGNLTIVLPNTLTRAAGGSVDFATAGAGTTTFRTSAANANTILGTATTAPATWNGATWAVQTGSGTLGGLAAGGYNTLAGHLDLPSGAVPVPGGTLAATARLNVAGATTVDLSGGTTTLAQGGLLTTAAIGANPVTVQNGTLVSGGNEFFIHQHNTAGSLTISAVLGGANPVITKAGAGALILTGANTGTGSVNINQGTLQVGAGGAGGTAGTLPTGAITNDGSFVLARTNGTFAAPYQLAAGNVISGAGSVTVDAGSGWVDFNRVTNTYTGQTTIASGYALNWNNTSGQTAPVTLADGGANPAALVFNPTAATTVNFPIIVSPGTGAAIIGTAGGTLNTIYNGTLELNRPTTLTSYTTDRTSFASSITGNVGTLTIDVGAGAAAATTGLLPGAALPALGGTSRRVTLEGENSFVGNVEIRNGAQLQLGLGTAGVFRSQIPDASDVSLFGTGSTLQLSAEGEVINNLNGEVGTLVRSISTGGSHMALTVNGGTFDGSYDGGVNGGMYIEKTSSGTLNLGGTGDNPTGKVRMNEGVLNLNKASSATVHAVSADLTIHGGTVVHTGTGDDQIADGTIVTMNGGTMDLNGKSDTISGLQGLGGTVTNNAAGTTSTLAIGSTTNAASSVFYGSINDGAGAVKLVKNSAVGHGLVLAANNNYSGGTSLDAGVLQIGNGGTAGTAGSGAVTTAANTRVVVDRSDTFNLANDIAGGGGLINQGSGTLVLTGNNTHTGLNTINHGSTTVIGNGGTSGSIGTGNISNFGELRFNRSDTLVLNQSIADLDADKGTVRQAGSGTTVLAGNSLYYGNTFVDDGTLQVDGNLWSGPVTVAAGAALGGNGLITTANVSISGSLAPGASPGVLDIDAPIVFSGPAASFDVELGGSAPGTGGGFYDQVNMTKPTGSVTLGTQTVLNLSLTGGFTPTVGDTFYVMTRADSTPFADAIAGLPEATTFSAGGYFWQITYQANWTGTQAGSSLTGGNDIALLAVVPEPSAAVLAVGAALAGLGFRRRRA